MKPAQPAVGGRTPYAERERQINEFCTCHYVWSQKPDGAVTRHERMWRDPACKLHGNRVERTPY